MSTSRPVNVSAATRPSGWRRTAASSRAATSSARSRAFSSYLAQRAVVQDVAVRRVLVELVMHVRRHEHRLPTDERGVDRGAQADERIGVEIRERLVEKNEWDLLRLDPRKRRAPPLSRGEPLDRPIHLAAEAPLSKGVSDVVRHQTTERSEEREV